MKFVEIVEQNYAPFIVLVAIAAAALVAAIIVLCVASSRREFSVLTNVTLGTLLALGLGLAIGANFTLSDPFGDGGRGEQLKEVKGQIEDRYDIRLAKDELQDLSYPRSEPEKDFEVFGTVTRNVELKDGFERQEVSLLWRNDRFELAQSKDGQGFTALKPRGDSSAEGSVSDEPFFAPSPSATEKPTDD